MKGVTVPPELTAVSTEWFGEIQQGIKRTNEFLLDKYTTSKTDEILTEINRFENEPKVFNEKMNGYIKQFEAKMPVATDWIKLPDGYSYSKIAPNGYYSFFRWLRCCRII